MSVTASQLRQNIYKLLDQVLATGQPLEIRRGGKKLFIQPMEAHSRLMRLKKRNCLLGDPETLVSLDWSAEWKGHDLP